jgi:hypothetical protein
VIDHNQAEELAAAWARYGMAGIALDLVDCPDRRLTRAAVTVVAGDLVDGQTEVSVLLPDRKYSGFWRRILHDQTAEGIVREVSRLPHANVTTVPFHFGKGAVESDGTLETAAARPAAPDGQGARSGRRAVQSKAEATDGTVPIASVRWRQRAVVEGRVRSVRVVRVGGTCTTECVIEDGTGAMSIVFLGRPRVAGVEIGTRMRVAGTAGDRQGRLAILNPEYQLLNGRE